MIVNNKVIKWLIDDLEQSKEMLEKFAPELLDTSTGLDCYATCKQLVYIGGDYYDFFVKSDNRSVIAIGDVSGKGISAALMMSNLRSSLGNVMSKGNANLVSTVTQLNKLVFESSTVGKFITFFLAIYDSDNSRLSYVNAGHNPPLLFRSTSQYELPKKLTIESLTKKKENLPLGMMPEISYTQGSETLGTGDIIVAYTDGITEIQNSSFTEWGENSLIKVIQKNCHLTSKEIVEKVFEAIEKFSQGNDSIDDMTLIVIKTLP